MVDFIELFRFFDRGGGGGGGEGGFFFLFFFTFRLFKMMRGILMVDCIFFDFSTFRPDGVGLYGRLY